MSNVFAHRGVMDNDALDSIDDPRNGLLLWSSLHQWFGPGEIAFLKVCHQVLIMVHFQLEHSIDT